MTEPESEVIVERRGHAPPWLFGILVQPFSAAVGFLALAVPSWLSGEGMSLAKIAVISGTAFLPHAFKVFWSPLIDIGAKRKIWYFGGAIAVAGFLWAAIVLPDPIHHLGLFTTLLTLAQVAAATSSSALDSLMALNTDTNAQGRAGGFYAAGNVGGTTLLGALFIWMTEHTRPGLEGPLVAVIVLLTCVGGIVLVDSKAATDALTEVKSLLAKGMENVRAIVSDLWATLKTKEGITGLIICGAPVGAGAITNLWTGMAGSYHVSKDTLDLFAVVVGGTSSLGSVVGGFIADRISRRLAYCLSGGLTALIGLAWAMGPFTPTTFLLGISFYGFANGMAFAAFYGLVLEVVSHGAAVTTKYTSFVAIANLAGSYVTAWDGFSGTLPVFARFGKAAPLVGDALITFAGISLVALMTLIARGTTKPTPVVEPS